VELKQTSKGAPDFYLRDLILFKCVSKDFINLQKLSLKFKIDDDVYETSCQRSRQQPKIWVKGTDSITHVDGIEGPDTSEDYCSASGKADGFTLKVRLRVDYTTVKGIWYCEGLEGLYNILSKKIEMKEIKGNRYFTQYIIYITSNN